MPKPFFRRFTKVFIFFNVVVAVLFLLGGCAKYFDPSNGWFVGILNLAFPYLLFILAIFFIGWIFIKPTAAIISVIAVLVAWGQVQQIMPFRISADFKIKKDSGTIRIMSWNVEQFNILFHKTHPEVKEKMLQLINEFQPDIACFQEMVGGENPKAINNIYAIQKTMHFPDFFYCYNVREDFDNHHHFGIIIFSKFPFINKEIVNNNSNYYNSIFQFADIVANKDTLRIFNIHLQSMKFTEKNLAFIDNPTNSSDSNLEKSKNIISKLKSAYIKRGLQADRVRAEINKSIYPPIVCGDFNDVPNSYAYATIGKGLQNAFVEKGRWFGRTFSGISPTLRIDNIFADKRFEIEQFTRIKQKLSDHFPILTDIKMKKSFQ